MALPTVGRQVFGSTSTCMVKDQEEAMAACSHLAHDPDIDFPSSLLMVDRVRQISARLSLVDQDVCPNDGSSHRRCLHLFRCVLSRLLLDLFQRLHPHAPVLWPYEIRIRIFLCSPRGVQQRLVEKNSLPAPQRLPNKLHILVVLY